MKRIWMKKKWDLIMEMNTMKKLRSNSKLRQIKKEVKRKTKMHQSMLRQMTLLRYLIKLLNRVVKKINSSHQNESSRSSSQLKKDS